ncbi:hypothetical protein MKZ38_004984 [Zalerion maritima]|uniref:Cytochrome P450 n=1 Tax=Zalerion maritima TaxID=339359 RepID=A0AAD5WPK1_9PEZI|nr:hypothetical protein MKZ38_004984 [Zalerion maritima]
MSPASHLVHILPPEHSPQNSSTFPVCLSNLNPTHLILSKVPASFKANPLHLSLSLAIYVLAIFLLRRLISYHAKTRLSHISPGGESPAHLLQKCSPPFSKPPARDPFLGLDFLLQTISAAKQRKYLSLVQSRFLQHGPTFVNSRLLYQTVHTVDPENVKHVLATGFGKFGLPSVRRDAMRPLFGAGIFTSEGGGWKHSRGMLRRVFGRRRRRRRRRRSSSKGADGIVGMMGAHFELLLGRIPEPAPPPRPPEAAAGAGAGADEGRWTPRFDLQELIYSFAMDVGTEFLLGKSTHALDPSRSSEEDRQFVGDYTAVCLHAVKQIQLGPLGRFLWSPAAMKKRDGAWRYVEGFVDEALAAQAQTPSRPRTPRRGAVRSSTEGDESEESFETESEGGEEEEEKEEEESSDGEKKEPNFLQALTAATPDRAAIRDEILSILLASRDTTASLISNLFFELARRPDLYAELRREVLETIGERNVPTEEQVKGMKFMRWCINESLRLHPPVPANSRQALAATTLPHGGGPDGLSPLFVPRGSTVIFSVYSMHRMPSIFGPETEKFRPHRWDGLRPGWGFLPFNGGPRICLGQQFALVEAGYVVARLVQQWEELRSMDDRDWEEFYTLAVCNRHGTWILGTEELDVQWVKVFADPDDDPFISDLSEAKGAHGTLWQEKHVSYLRRLSSIVIVDAGEGQPVTRFQSTGRQLLASPRR